MFGADMNDSHISKHEVDQLEIRLIKRIDSLAEKLKNVPIN